MTEGELLHLIETGSALNVLEALSALDEAERRRFAHPVMRRFRQWYDCALSFGDTTKEPVVLVDEDGLKVALLATATASELKRSRFHAIPRNISLSEVVRALRPGWIDRWVANLIEDSPYLVGRLEPLWKDGLCAKPESDAFILGYYARAGTLTDLDTPEFLESDVWRFFEVEGGGEFSLAAHDKYSGPEGQWATILLELCRQGRLDRDRLLDASLDALERDFGQFRAGWYARFHILLVPTLDEQAARVDRYLRLLSSAVPPTVSFALKALKALDKAKRLAPDVLIPELAPALQAREKSTVTAALQLLNSAARRQPERAIVAARLAATALISETSDVQWKALDLIQKLEAYGDDDVRATLQAHADLVAPSLRDRVVALTGAEGPADQEERAVGRPVIVPEVQAIPPFENLDAAFEAYLEVLESPRDPVAVERAMDGLARYGAGARAIGDKLSPLAKRARQILGRRDESGIRLGLAATVRAWCEAVPLADLLTAEFPEASHQALSPQYYANAFIARNGEILERVLSGHSVPMLSSPSDTTGRIAPSDLLERMAVYRDQGIAPGRTDLSLALLRLRREGREDAGAALDPKTEADRALAFALGADETPQGDAALWVAAWGARDPASPHEGVRVLVGDTIPDAGVPASCEMIVERNGDAPYFWCGIQVNVSPAPQPDVEKFLTSRFHLPRRHRWGAGNPCGRVYSDIAWASLVWPSHTEGFFSWALMAMDTDEKLSDHPCIAYLEPLLRPGPAPGPLARAALALYLASTDKSVVATTEEAIVTLVARGTLDPDDFATAVRRFVVSGALPTARWTRCFANIAAASAEHAAFIRQVITRLLGFAPDDVPRDMGGMIELLFELHTGAAKSLDDPVALKCLKEIRAGGKAGRFSRKLLEMSAET